MDANSQLYLDLLKRNLTNSIFLEKGMSDDLTDLRLRGPVHEVLWRKLKNVVARKLKPNSLERQTAEREVGQNWPRTAETMVGLSRLTNIEQCIEDVVKNNIPGDLIETGVWRGGTTIFMRAVLKVLDVNDRTVWVADSFEGLPKPDKKYPADDKDRHHSLGFLAVTVDEVKCNFKRYHMLDDKVKFLQGWFEETLPNAPIEQLAILRLDGDMYGSTIVALENLYPKLNNGGYAIIDDYGVVDGCRKAVLDYRQKNGIEDEIITIDKSSCYWKKQDN